MAGLDRSVVRSALAVGILEEHLLEMAGLLRKRPQRMEDLPRPESRGAQGTALDESADEDDGYGMEGGEPPDLLPEGNTLMEKAIVQLTKICTQLAKPSSKKGNSIEQLLDGSGLEKSGDGFGLTGVRKNATALRALRRCLPEQLEYIYTIAEGAMLQDFQSRPVRPGEPMHGGTVRGWLESRTRITNRQAHVRWAWAVGAIWGALTQNNVKEARARCALLVVAADQLSIDAGSWILSGVALLEPPPPFHTFATHQSPTPQEIQHSSFLDPRWVELFLFHVKEMDNYQEMKKKFSRGSSSSSAPARPEAEAKAKPKAKPKAKAKNKGKEKGGGSTEAEAKPRLSPEFWQSRGSSSPKYPWQRSLSEAFPNSDSRCKNVGSSTELARKKLAIEDILLKLEEMGRSLKNATKSARYFGDKLDRNDGEKDHKDAGIVCGHLQRPTFSTFKTVEADRLQFVGVPNFDPVPFLDPASAAIYQNPLSLSLRPEEYHDSVPFVHVYCSKAEKMKLFCLLDSCKRLGLHRQSEVRTKFSNGLFSVVKSMTRDRLILDSRPANLLEKGEQRWIGSLASAESLCKVVIPDDHYITTSGNDLRDFYCLFAVSEERSRRNVLAGAVCVDDVRHLSCFSEDLDTGEPLYGALSPLAMGDSQAVSMAQTCHVGVVVNEKVETLYKDVGLIPHPDKAFSDEEKNTFWAADFDGRRGRSGNDVARLSKRMLSEMLICATLLPLAVTNLRAKVAGRITATDASDWGEAVVEAEITPILAQELYKHVLRKSVWTRLLAPADAWLRSHGFLLAEHELPDSTQCFSSNPLWSVLARCLEYKLLYKIQCNGRRHINIGELRGFLKAEKKLGLQEVSTRHLFALDSQVCLGCIVKGRSTSESLNKELSRSLPIILFCDIYSECMYFRTAENPADDPTRGTEIRKAAMEVPEWLVSASVGSFDALDSWLDNQDIGDYQLSGLPPVSEL
eukprot:s2486_g3.t1